MLSCWELPQFPSLHNTYSAAEEAAQSHRKSQDLFNLSLWVAQRPVSPKPLVCFFPSSAITSVSLLPPELRKAVTSPGVILLRQILEEASQA